jgi:hypothetical protein
VGLMLSAVNSPYAMRQPIGHVTVCQDSKPMQPILLKDVREKQILPCRDVQKHGFLPMSKVYLPS